MPKKRQLRTIPNPDGVEIPVADLAKTVIKRDKMVRGLFKHASIISSQISKFKDDVDKQVNDYLKQIASEHHETWQGNTILYNYSQEFSIEVSVSKTITFDERLQIAKKKIDKCIESWADGSNRNLKTLVMHAFKVDRAGNINTKMILSLRQYQITDPDWKEAMELIADAVMVTGTKKYYIFRQRDEDGQMQPVILNFSRV
jgi:hypothetical protein